MNTATPFVRTKSCVGPVSAVPFAPNATVPLELGEVGEVVGVSTLRCTDGEGDVQTWSSEEAWIGSCPTWPLRERL